jgi:hypothetical protein
MNKTNLDDFRKHPDMDISLYKIPSPEHKNEGNYTFDYINTTAETKYIYVATTNKWRDSWKNESTSEVEKAIVAVSPDKLCWIVDTNETVTFTVKWNGELLNGTLTLIGVNNTYPDSNRNNTWYGNESLPHYGVIDVTATNGIVKVHNMNATELGNVTFKFTPSEPEEGEKANADGMLKVVLPTVTIEPRIIFLSEENIIKVTVTNPRNGAPCPDLRLWGGFLLEFEKTDENGETTGGVFPISTGNYTLSVGRTLWDGKEVKDAWYKVVVGLKIDAPSETEEEKEITIQVLTRGGKEVSGATVTIGNWTGTTDDEGKVTYKPTKKGDYIITAKKDGYYPSEGASTPLSVKKAPKPPGFEAVALIIGAIVALLLVDHRRKKRRYT